MDVGTIMVAVMTLAAGGFLVWLEIHSRRNRQQEPKAPADQAVAEPPQRRRRKRHS